MRRPLLLSLALLGACASPPTSTEGPAAGPGPKSPPFPKSPQVASVDWNSAVQAEVRALREQLPGARVRVVVLDPTGSTVLASHGDVDGKAPTGSTIKALTIHAALAAGLDPETRLDTSQPVRVGERRFQDLHDNGTVDVPMALAKSSNVAVVRAVQAVSWREVYAAVAERVSLPPLDGITEAQALGQLDGLETQVSLRNLVSAYARMATQEHGADVLDMLRLAVGPRGTGARAQVPGVEVLGKTGTARNDGVQHALFIGQVTDDSTSAWIGVAIDDVPHDVWGGTLAAPVFARIVQGALRP